MADPTEAEKPGVKSDVPALDQRKSEPLSGIRHLLKDSVYSSLSEKLQSLDIGCKNDTLDNLKHIKKETQDNIKMLIKKIQEKENELQKLSAESEQRFDSYKYEEKLYYRITRTAFDLNPEPDTVTGYCSLGEVKTFEFNEKENSQFSITNHLWDLLDAPNK